MSLTEQEKEELFSEFTVRMAEMDKDEKKLRVAQNNHVMKGVTRYYRNHFDWTNVEVRKDDRVAFDDELGERKMRYYGTYTMYLKLRKVIPNMVMAKKHRNESLPGYLERKNNTDYRDDPLLHDEDEAEATKCAEYLFEAMLKYLESD